MKFILCMSIWMLAAFLQANVFHIEHDAYVMLYGGVTMALMIIVMELFDNRGK